MRKTDPNICLLKMYVSPTLRIQSTGHDSQRYKCLITKECAVFNRVIFKL